MWGPVVGGMRLLAPLERQVAPLLRPSSTPGEATAAPRKPSPTGVVPDHLFRGPEQQRDDDVTV